MKHPLLILFLAVISFADTLAIDSVPAGAEENRTGEKFRWPAQILPISALIGGAALTAGDVKEQLQEKMPKTENNLDDALVTLPAVGLYAADLVFKDHKSSVSDQTKMLILTQGSLLALTMTVKQIVYEPRPDGSNTHSFYSGHTAHSFAAASVLAHEYKDTRPFLAYSGYGISTAVGILRVTNSKHWVPDVVFGAGMGVLITNLAYWINPLPHWHPFSKSRGTVLVPSFWTTPDDRIAISLSGRF